MSIYDYELLIDFISRSQNHINQYIIDINQYIIDLYGISHRDSATDVQIRISATKRYVSFTENVMTAHLPILIVVIE